LIFRSRDEFETTPAELITTEAVNAGVRRTADDDVPTPLNVAPLRPKRARIVPDQ
jgi:hypothetical protein